MIESSDLLERAVSYSELDLLRPIGFHSQTSDLCVGDINGLHRRLLEMNPNCTLSGARYGSCLRIRGSGGDGGCTGAESRSSYLEMYKEKTQDKVDPMQRRHARWTQCSYSGNPLKPPIVADVAGSLFNKEDLLQGLHAKAMGAQWPQNLAHIKMKDLLMVKPTMNQSFGRELAGGNDSARPDVEAPFECPLTGVPLNGRSRVFLHKPSGLLLSDSGLKKLPKIAQEIILRATKEALSTSEELSTKKSKKSGVALAKAMAEACISRGGAWTESELLVVNPEGDDEDKAKALLHCLTSKEKAKTKAVKAGTNGIEGQHPQAKRPAMPSDTGRLGTSEKKAKTILQSLFHDDGEGAVVGETYLCRSVGARGFRS